MNLWNPLFLRVHHQVFWVLTKRVNLFTMSTLFRDARLKIDRAKKHIAELKAHYLLGRKPHLRIEAR